MQENQNLLKWLEAGKKSIIHCKKETYSSAIYRSSLHYPLGGSRSQARGSADNECSETKHNVFGLEPKIQGFERLPLVSVGFRSDFLWGRKVLSSAARQPIIKKIVMFSHREKSVLLTFTSKCVHVTQRRQKENKTYRNQKHLFTFTSTYKQQQTWNVRSTSWARSLRKASDALYKHRLDEQMGGHSTLQMFFKEWRA